MWTLQAQQQAVARAREAIKIIERLLPQAQQRYSPKRQQVLERAYQTLTRQSTFLGMSIDALDKNFPLEKLLKGTQHFKHQLEQRYSSPSLNGTIRAKEGGATHGKNAPNK